MKHPLGMGVEHCPPLALPSQAIADLLCRATPDQLQQGPMDPAADPSRGRGVGVKITSHSLVQSKPLSGESTSQLQSAENKSPS